MQYNKHNLKTSDFLYNTRGQQGLYSDSRYFDSRLEVNVERPWVILERQSCIDHDARRDGDHPKIIDPFAWHAFTIEEILVHHVAKAKGREGPIVHFWQGGPSLILGYQDTRLPNVERALYALVEQGFSFFVRPSGGRVVVLDSGVLNISVMLPDGHQRSYSLHETFRWMAGWMVRALARLGFTIEVGEVEGSYCPGRYDLAILSDVCAQRSLRPGNQAMQKIAGLAQRRIQGGIILTAFLNIRDTGYARGEVARLFYRLAGGTDRRNGDPEGPKESAIEIVPQRITSLYPDSSESPQQNGLRQTVIEALLASLYEYAPSLSLPPSDITHDSYMPGEEVHILRKMYKSKGISGVTNKALEAYWHEQQVKIGRSTDRLMRRLSILTVGADDER